MAKFLTTSGTSYHIEQIIIDAKKTVVFLSPYLFLSKILLERLQDADRKGTKIIIVYNQNKLRPAEIEVLKDFKYLEIFYSPNLHAKCYFNAQEMIVTSMNMYEFSEKNNREMGILINRKEDSELYFDVCREAKSILAASQRCDSQGQPLTSVDKTISVTKSEPINNSVLSDKAFCIRCHGDITFNLHRPLCAKCYVAWVKTKNRRHPEKYCHQCGLEVKTSLVKPICKQCFVMSKK